MDRSRLAAILENTSDLVATATPDGSLSYLNKAGRRLVGWSLDETLLDRRFVDIHPKWANDIIDEEGLRTAAKHGVWEGETALLHRAGHELPCSQVILSHKAPDGSIEYFSTIIRDISKEKQIKAALRKSEQWYKALVETSPDPIVIFSAKGEILSVNRQAAKLYGVETAEEFLEELKTITDLILESEYEKARANIKETLESGSSQFNEYDVRLKNGDIARCEMHSKLLEDSDGKPMFISVVRDITERRRAEAELQKTQALLAVAMEQSPSGILIADAPDVRIRFANSRALGIRGKTSEELTEIDVDEHAKKWQTFHADGTPYKPEHLPLSRAVLEGVTSENVEVVIVDESGERRWVSTNAGPIRDSENQITSGIVIFQDITDRKRSEEELRLTNERLVESEGTFRSIVESSPMGMHLYELDLEGRLIFQGANPAAARILDFEHQPHVGKICEEVFPQLKGTEIPDRYRELAREGGTWSTSQIDYDDERMRGAFEVFAFQTAPRRIATMFLDITERIKGDERLRESEAKFRGMAENFADLLFITDMGGKLAYLSPSAREVFGFDPKSMEGRLFVEFLPEDQIPIALAEFQRVISLGEHTVLLQLMMKRADGSLFPGELSASVMVQGERIVGTLGWIRDVSERVRSEEEKQRLESQLQQAMKMEAIGRLAGGIAHDFNNLLTGIIGNIELALMDIEKDEHLTMSLEEVSKAAESASALTRQLLAFSRKQMIEPKVIDLNQVLESLRRMLVRLIGEDVSLQVRQAKHLWSVCVDPGQFEQILVNLAVNARDAMPDGGKLLIETTNTTLDDSYCSRHSYVQPGEFVMLAVSDTGLGMSEEVKGHLFEPFFTTKPKGRGTGLGLATIYGTVKQAGGSIEVYSEQGHGTSFKIYIPREHQRARRHDTDLSVGELPGGRETILLVEDEEIVRTLAVKILSRLGYNVLQAGDGSEALEEAESFEGPIDLLLTDVVMPGMNGRQLSEKLLEQQSDMRVLYTSGYTENAIAHHGVIDEGLDFISKPYTPQSLARKLREVFDREG